MFTYKYLHSYRINCRTADIEMKLIIDIGGTVTIFWNICNHFLWTRCRILTFHHDNKVSITARITSIQGKVIHVREAGKSITATKIIEVFLHIVHILKLNQLNACKTLAIDKLKWTMEHELYQRGHIFYKEGTSIT